jgi:succinyl-CoA synthetase alpha subunit
MDESKPKPMSAIDPAKIPAATATTLSITFQEMVRYSSHSARRKTRLIGPRCNGCHYRPTPYLGQIAIE